MNEINHATRFFSSMEALGKNPKSHETFRPADSDKLKIHKIHYFEYKKNVELLSEWLDRLGTAHKNHTRCECTVKALESRREKTQDP